MDVRSDRKELHRALKLVGTGAQGYPRPEVVSLAADDEGLWVRSNTVICPPSPGTGPDAIPDEIALEMEVRVATAGGNDETAQAARPAGSPGVRESAEHSLSLSMNGDEAGTDKSVCPTMRPKLLLDLLGRFEEGEVRLRDEEEKLVMRSGSYECTLPLGGWEVRHPLPEIGRGQHIIVEGEELRAGLRAALGIACRDDTRPTLCSVQMIASRDQITLFATDTYRLIKRSVPCQGYGMREGTEWRATIPALSVMKIIGASSQAKSEAVRLRREGQPELPWAEKGAGGQAGVPVLLVEVGNVRMRCGLWPRYTSAEKVLQEREEIITRWVELERRELMRALKRADLVAQGDSHRTILSIKDGEVAMTAKALDQGASSESVPATLQGDAMEIAFNARYLAEGLSVFGGERVRVGMAGELHPAVLRDQAGGEDRYVIMPMQVM